MLGLRSLARSEALLSLEYCTPREVTSGSGVSSAVVPRTGDDGGDGMKSGMRNAVNFLDDDSPTCARYQDCAMKEVVCCLLRRYPWEALLQLPDPQAY